MHKARQQIAAAVIATLLLPICFAPAWGSSHFTEKQYEAFALYIDKTFWVTGEESKIPAFQSAPSPSAPSFRPGAKESFEIKEIVRGKGQIPSYYKVAFASGREGFVTINSFLEELHGSFAAVDPDWSIKRKLAKEAEGESKRQEWIQKQRWSGQVKEAALKKQPVLGMSTAEAKVILGKPKRLVAVKNTNPLMGKQEQWIYEEGPVLTFTNGLLTRIQPKEAPSK